MSLVKQFSHRDVTYTISIDLHYKNERRIGGKSFHRFIINIEKFDYEDRYEVDSRDDIIVAIAKAETDTSIIIDNFIDNKITGQDKSILLSLGFNDNSNKRSPLSPKDMPTTFPDYIYESFDILIAQNFNISKRESIVYQKDVVNKILELTKEKKIKDITSNYIFKHNLLDVEEWYRNAGWDVKYVEPDFRSSSFPEYFVFKQK